MEIYLPIAQMSVQWLIIMGLGFGVGFLSGVFGIGGGFLLTPLLILYGIPPGVAVATTASQISGVTFSGVLTHWKRHSVDFKMGSVMMLSGLFGTVAGVWLFSVFRRMGQAEVAVSGSYVVLLGMVGSLMLQESMRTWRAQMQGGSAASWRSGQHNWVHGLPLKMRFRRSRLYISAIPPVLLGFIVGMMSAVMGVGGAFLMVPAMIYVLKMPTNVVIGTSTFQVLFVTALTTVLHAIDNHTVDILLAFLLILGGVFGAQYGVRFGARLPGEQIRFYMSLLILVVAISLLLGLLLRPTDLYRLEVGTP